MPSDHDSSPSGSSRLRTTKFAVALLVAGTFLAANRSTFFPFLAWTMYAYFTPQRAADSGYLEELRLVFSGGTTRVVPLAEVAGADREDGVDAIVASAFGSQAGVAPEQSRAYLKRVLGDRGLGRIQSIELWRMEWAVHPDALPPLELDRPIKEIRLGALRMDGPR